MRFRVRSLASLSGLRTRRCRELWCRPAATAPIGPLVWEPPYAEGAALKKDKGQKTKNKKQKIVEEHLEATLHQVLDGYQRPTSCFLENTEDMCFSWVKDKSLAQAWPTEDLRKRQRRRDTTGLGTQVSREAAQ